MAPKRSAPEPAPVVEEEAAFPRGGGSSLSALEAKQARAEGAAQARAEIAAGPGRKKARKDVGISLVSTSACTRSECKSNFKQGLT